MALAKFVIIKQNAKLNFLIKTAAKKLNRKKRCWNELPDLFNLSKRSTKKSNNPKIFLF